MQLLRSQLEIILKLINMNILKPHKPCILSLYISFSKSACNVANASHFTMPEIPYVIQPAKLIPWRGKSASIPPASLKALKLLGMAGSYDDTLDTAIRERKTMAQFLASLCQIEAEDRRVRSIRYHLNQLPNRHRWISGQQSYRHLYVYGYPHQ